MNSYNIKIIEDRRLCKKIKQQVKLPVHGAGLAGCSPGQIN
jgi:hypothetical protein